MVVFAVCRAFVCLPLLVSKSSVGLKESCDWLDTHDISEIKADSG